MVKPCTVLLVDDHALVRAGLRAVLGASLPEVSVVEAASLSDATSKAQLPEGMTPDLVLLDVELPGLSGLDGIGLLHQHWPGVPIVILSTHSDTLLVRTAIERGALAFVSKSESLDELMSIVRFALQGRATAPDFLPPVPQLTPRQCDVLDLICQGLSNKGIARRLGVAENTVRVHVQAVLTELRAASRWEAMVIARTRGLVH